MAEPVEIPVEIRPYRTDDAAACLALYEAGLIGTSRLATNDTGLDMDDIWGNYIRVAGNGFWVAIGDKWQVVGMIGVQHHDQGVGEIRRLRVRKDSQRRGVGSKLLDRAISFCLDNGYLKITLDTHIGGLPYEAQFGKYHYRLERTKQLDGGRELRYFFRDIYARDGDSPPGR